MIGFLSGQPVPLESSLLVIVQGVGYEVKVSQPLLSQLSKSDRAELHIYTHVREDKFELYGFETLAEKQLFQVLLGVSGVGPSIALGLVAGGTTQLVAAVQEAQTGFFTALPRVGKKLAQKIIIELRGKLGELKALDLSPLPVSAQEALEALVNLGFSEDAVREVLSELDTVHLGVEKTITAALKKLKR